MLGAIAVLALVATSCSGRTEILSTSASPDGSVETTETASETTDLGETDPSAIAAVPTPLAIDTSTETTPVVDTVEPGDWINHDVGAFALDVPGEWQAMTRPTQVAPIIEAAQETGAEFPRQAISQFQKLLENGNAIIAVGDAGDNVNAFRQFGSATALVYHEEIVEALTLEFAGFASDVSFTSEPRLFGETPGVLVRGSYSVEGEKLHMYQFQTHSGTYLYFFTITLFSGDDPALATEMFRSIEVR